VKERILIVDDEASVRKLVRTILGKEGYGCHVATDAEEARSLLREHPFDLVLCDIMMPGESGLSLIRHVSEAFPDTGIVMVTAMDDPETAESALGFGVYGYVVKPFEPSQILISTVNALKRRDLEVQARAHLEQLEQTVQDRTKELRQAFRTLEQAERRYRDLFEQSLDMIYLTGMDGEVLEINPAGLELLGYDRKAIQGLNALDLYVDPGERLALQRKIEERGLVRDHEIRLKRADGEVITCLVSATLWKDDDGTPKGYQGILRDITNQRRMEQQLRQAHQENLQLLAAISSLLIGIDPAGRIIRWNTRAEDILGLPAQDVLDRPFAACDIPWAWSMVRDGIARSRRYQEPVRLEDVPFSRPDGTKGFLGISLNPILFEDTREPGLLVMGADITEKRRLEVQLSQAQRLEAIGQLAAGIAHEINTPTQYVGDNTRFLGEAFDDLRGVLDRCADFLEAFRTDADAESQALALERAVEEADLAYLMEEVPTAVAQTLEGVERVARIVRSMKEFSHPGSREMTWADLNRALENTITVARNEWKYVAELETDLDPSLPSVPCLPGELNQVFLNLIVNAAHALEEKHDRASGEKGAIRVSTRRTGDIAEIRVSDTGPGIPEEARDRIFDPFFTTKEVGRGTGQGLAIARSVVVEKHGGSILFETEAGRGTTFIVRLPLSRDPSVDESP
jgi:PAS domain S-box-containing protein